jgi:ATPase subunit of ABC transporter with duplicated ATPase domains
MKYAGCRLDYLWNRIIKAETIRIGVVGPCGAGKSTLIACLRQNGYVVKHIAQEHSYVKDMWKRLTNPDILIYLDVSYLTSCIRRKMDWTESEYLEEVFRLRHARQAADFYLNTDGLTIEEVFQMVQAFLR